MRNYVRYDSEGRWTEECLSLLQQRYYWGDEKTPEEMCRRVANAVGKTDLERERCYDLLINQYFIFNSPTMMNIGTGNGMSGSACFVVPIPDDIEGILKAHHDQIMIHRTGGGTGFAFSRLRPDGAVVRGTQGTASGPVSFMRMFDIATDVIKQGGRRRGANMAVLRCDHPDIIQFITCKLPDDKGVIHITNFNISVGVTTEFMQAVRNDGYYPLYNPNPKGVLDRAWREPIEDFDFRLQNKLNYLIRTARDENGGWMLHAGDVLNLMVKCAWMNGDPGMVYLDRANNGPANPVPSVYQIETTNPCVSGDTKIWTIYGPKRIDELADIGEDVPVLTRLDNGQLAYRIMRNIRQTRTDAEMIKLTFKANRRGKTTYTTLKVTPDHGIYVRTSKGVKKVKAKDIKINDSIASVYRHKANSKGYLKLENETESIMEHHVVVSWKYDRRPNYPEEHVDHIDENKQNNKLDNLRILPRKIHNALNMHGENNPVIKFGNPAYRDDIKDDEIIKLNRMGLSSIKIAAKLGCGRSTVERRLASLGIDHKVYNVNHRLVKVEKIKNRDVYNGIVDETHKYYIWTGKDEGILSANCGEQFLEPNGVCNLGSINVSKYVIQMGNWPYQEYDWKKLMNDAAFCARMLDHIIDINPMVTPEIEENVRKLRRIGLGIMGLHDALMLMGFPYDSEKGRSFAQRIMKTVHEAAVRESEKMAKEYGAFPLFDVSIYRDSKPRRNSNVTTIAPTGSISFMADCSSGCEPVFSLDYVHVDGTGVKRRVINTVMLDIAQACGVEADNVPDLIQEIQKVRYDIPVAEIFKTAMQIQPIDHVLMQAALQQYVDNSVSKTVNMPHTATEIDVLKVYLASYELGCMGITVFREGSRGSDQVLFDNTKKQQQPVLTGTRVIRPEMVDGKSVKINTPMGNVYVQINTFENDEDFREIFINTGKAGSDVQAMMEALGKAASEFLQTEQATPKEKLARLYDHWKGIGGRTSVGLGPNKVLSLPDAVAIAIGKVLGYTNPSGGNPLEQLEMVASERRQELEMGGGDACPECHRFTLVHTEGCLKCYSCGYAEC